MSAPALALIGTGGQIQHSTETFRRQYAENSELYRESPELERVLTGEADRALLNIEGRSAEIEAVVDASGRRHALLTVEHSPEDSSGDARNALLSEDLDQSPALVWLKDLEGRYLSINRRFSAELGTTLEQLSGRSDAEVPPGETVDGPRLQDGDAAGQDALLLEYLVPAFGERPPFAAFRFPVRDPDGNAIAVCGVAAPVSESRIAHEEVARLMEIERWSSSDPSAARAEMMAEWGVVVDAGGIVGTLADRPPAGEPSRTSAIDAQPGTGATREDALTGALASERTRAEALARALAEAEQQLAELHEAAAAGGAGEGKRQRGDASKSRAEAEAARAEEQAARAEADAARHEAAEALLHAERLGQEVGQWREQAERAESELHALRARLEQAEADAQQSRARLERAEAEAHGLRLRVEEATAGGERSERRLQEAQGDMQRLRERIEEGVADAERLRTRAEEAEAERERLHARLAEAQAADDRLRARLAEAEANADRLRARLEETEAHAERLRADLASAQTEAQGQARPHDVQPEVRAALAAAEAERDTAVRTNARLMEELKAGQRELAYVREVSAATAQRAQELVGALAAERRHTDDLLRAFREQSSASQHSRGSGGPDWLADTQRALLDALTQAATWPAGLASAVEVLGSGGAWDAVTAWSFSEPDDWHCEGVWTRDPDLQKFAGLTRKTPPSGDGSLHRQALQEPRLTWLSVLDAEHDARLVAVAEHGMRAALLLPIRAAGAPVGLIELVTRDSLDPDPQIVMGLEAAALHLGSFAERVTGAAG